MNTIKSYQHLKIRRASTPPPPSETEIELKENRPCKDIIIKRSQLEPYLIDYYNRCSRRDLISGLTAEMRIIRNIIKRYPHDDSPLQENDVEILFDMFQMNVTERECRINVYMHDALIDMMIKEFGMQNMIYHSSLFKKLNNF